MNKNFRIWIKKENITKIWPLVCNDQPNSADIRKFETLGTRSFPIEQGIGEAINFHTAIGSKRKEERIRYLKNYWASKVVEFPKVKIHTSFKPEFACGICGVSVDGMTPGELDSALFSKYKYSKINKDRKFSLIDSNYNLLSQSESSCQLDERKMVELEGFEPSSK